jgi:hypothetical protein
VTVAVGVDVAFALGWRGEVHPAVRTSIPQRTIKRRGGYLCFMTNLWIILPILDVKSFLLNVSPLRKPDTEMLPEREISKKEG